MFIVLEEVHKRYVVLIQFWTIFERISDGVLRIVLNNPIHGVIPGWIELGINKNLIENKPDNVFSFQKTIFCNHGHHVIDYITRAHCFQAIIEVAVFDEENHFTQNKKGYFSIFKRSWFISTQVLYTFSVSLRLGNACDIFSINSKVRIFGKVSVRFFHLCIVIVDQIRCFCSRIEKSQ